MAGYKHLKQRSIGTNKALIALQSYSGGFSLWLRAGTSAYNMKSTTLFSIPCEDVIF